MYQIIVKKQVLKFVEKQQKYIQENFNDWIKNQLPQTPETSNDGFMTNSLYQGLQVYKKRFGEFRALFTICDTEIIVTVFDFDSRGQIYKKR